MDYLDFKKGIDHGRKAGDMAKNLILGLFQYCTDGVILYTFRMYSISIIIMENIIIIIIIIVIIKG